MATFKVKKMNAQVVQNTEHAHNHGPLIHQSQITPGVKAQLQDLLTDITALTQSGAVSPEVGHELRNSVLTAADEVDAPAPRRRRLTAALSHAKEIAAGLTATAGIAEAIDRIVKALGGGA